MDGSSWLFPDGVDRERLLEMGRHMRPARRASFAVLGVALLACAPWLGWWTLAPLAVVFVVFRAVEARLDRMQRPEYVLFAAWAFAEAAIAASIAIAGEPAVPLLAWLALPIASLGARYSERGMAAGVAVALAMLLAVAFGLHAETVIDQPVLVIGPAALIVTIAMFQTVLMRSDRRHRGEAILDPLTGMLNRNALTQRATELELQSRLMRDPVALIVADVDHFKLINDEQGHAEGDAVLRDVAYVLRKTLRSFDLVYRVGGEEFLVLLPGADIVRAADMAETLRAAVAEDGRVTMSLGVAGSRRGEPFSYTAAFAAADAALYEAKRAGRDRVCADRDALAHAA